MEVNTDELVEHRKLTPSERGKMGGRTKGTTRDSKLPVILNETDDNSGYMKFKSILKLYPQAMRESIFARELGYSSIKDMEEFADDMAQGQVAVSPIVCRGDNCEYRERCAILKNGLAPIDSPCPIEGYMIGIWAKQWIDTLLVDTTNMVEFNQVSTMIICDLMLMRLRNKLSTSATGNIVYTPVGVDKFGNVILRMEAAPEISMEDKYNKMKERTLEALLATRESRAKHGIMDDKDLAKKGPQAIYKAQQLMKQLEGATKVMTQEVFSSSKIVGVIEGGEE